MAAQKKVDLKCVLLGMSNVGKTCLVQRFLHNRWTSGHVPTVGAAFGAREVVAGSKKVMLGVWDTAGSERYESMTRHYYHKAQGAVVCYDLTDAQSFEKAKFWVKELNAVEEDVVIALVGTKLDLIEEEGAQRAVPKSTIAQYARTINAAVFETSAKSGKNVDAAFMHIVKEFAANDNQQIKAYDPNVLVLQRDHVEEDAPAKSKCCG